MPAFVRSESANCTFSNCKNRHSVIHTFGRYFTASNSSILVEHDGAFISLGKFVREFNFPVIKQTDYVIQIMIVSMNDDPFLMKSMDNYMYERVVNV